MFQIRPKYTPLSEVTYLHTHAVKITMTNGEVKYFEVTREELRNTIKQLKNILGEE